MNHKMSDAKDNLYYPLDVKTPETASPTAITATCVVCGHPFSEFTVILNPATCPACQTPIAPCPISQRALVMINRHELSLLINWARNWAGKMADETPEICDGYVKVVNAIERRLEQANPRIGHVTAGGWLREKIERNEKVEGEEIDPTHWHAARVS